MTVKKKCPLCPLYIKRENRTVCAAVPARPEGRLRCSSEVKAAVLIAADIYRREHDELGTSMSAACKRAGIAPMQLYDYFFDGVKQVLATDIGTVPPRWNGADPGEIIPEPPVERELSPTLKKAEELAGVVARLQAIGNLEQEIVDLGYRKVLTN